MEPVMWHVAPLTQIVLEASRCHGRVLNNQLGLDQVHVEHVTHVVGRKQELDWLLVQLRGARITLGSITPNITG